MKFTLILIGVIKGMAISTVIFLFIIFKLIDDAVDRELEIKRAYSMIKTIQVNEENIYEVYSRLGLKDRKRIYEQLEFDRKRIILK